MAFWRWTALVQWWVGHNLTNTIQQFPFSSTFYMPKIHPSCWRKLTEFSSRRAKWALFTGSMTKSFVMIPAWEDGAKPQRNAFVWLVSWVSVSRRNSIWNPIILESWWRNSLNAHSQWFLPLFCRGRLKTKQRFYVGVRFKLHRTHKVHAVRLDASCEVV